MLYPSATGFPQHVGLIPDGGRRWAKLHTCSIGEAYRLTSSKLAGFAHKLFDLGVKEVSVYAASFENLKRSAAEVDELLASAHDALRLIINQFIRTGIADCRLVGQTDLIGKYMNKQVLNAFEDGQAEGLPRLNICLFYHPVFEINQAIARDPQGVFHPANLTVNRPLDLIFRSGGYNLLSNFLPLQSGYARIYCVDELFNDVQWQQVEKVLNQFALDERKIGN